MRNWEMGMAYGGGLKPGGGRQSVNQVAPKELWRLSGLEKSRPTLGSTRGWAARNPGGSTQGQAGPSEGS